MGINFNEIKIHAHTEQRISLSLEAFHILTVLSPKHVHHFKN